MWWVQFWRQTRQFVEEPRCKQPWHHLSPPTQTQCLTSSHLHQKQTYHVIWRLLMRVSSCLEDWWFYLRGRPMARSEEVDFHCDWIKRSPMNRSFPSHLVSLVSLKSQMTSGADVAKMENLREEDRWKRKLAKIGQICQRVLLSGRSWHGRVWYLEFCPSFMRQIFGILLHETF